MYNKYLIATLVTVFIGIAGALTMINYKLQAQALDMHILAQFVADECIIQ